MLRIVHLSDPHFSDLHFTPQLFKTKRWLGMLNLFLFRQKRYATSHLEDLPTFLQTLEADHICITGDFSSLALDSEFAEAKNFTDKLARPFFHVPGNHDYYTKQSEVKRTYYNYFPALGLEKHRIEKHALGYGWWWIGLDCARANSLVYSNGRFYQEMDQRLKDALSEIPSGDRVIVGNHFPLYPAGRPKHDLERGDKLLEILLHYPSVKLYLHGHDHSPYIRERQLLALNAGSCARTKAGSFYVLDLHTSHCHLKRYAYTPNHRPFHWVVDLERTLSY
ncbi:MAG: metallophosphoesterase [Chlamydiales bacterium]|nr:metallophosphoesterase [Chlamydiales bacterium]